MPMVPRKLSALSLLLALSAASSAAAQGTGVLPLPSVSRCDGTERALPARDPTPAELRCRYGIRGPGRFGLSEFMDVPVYQPRTPLPGTHVVGVAGLPGPRKGEGYEGWEWRVLRTGYGAEARRVHRGVEVLDPFFGARILRLERRLAELGVRAHRRETWRSPVRQEYLFQQGRSRPGPFATSTLTSWHSRVDVRGNPAARAADYTVPAAHMRRFHEVVREMGLESFGADSNDPGHVFLPGSERVEGAEVALLRLLPRVPVVTLATGRPADERPTPAALRELRALARRWLVEPFAAPRLDPALPALWVPRLHTAAESAPAPAAALR